MRRLVVWITMWKNVILDVCIENPKLGLRDATRGNRGLENYAVIAMIAHSLIGQTHVSDIAKGIIIAVIRSMKEVLSYTGMRPHSNFIPGCLPG